MNTGKFDIVFIDGLHISEQVVMDIQNSLDVLNPKGTIVMHDCLPINEAAQSRERLGDHWNGDVWKAFAHYLSLIHI
jgi:predicted O-methyltransferase YrrM